jgi:branched-chain amino acid transport system permease protein
VKIGRVWGGSGTAGWVALGLAVVFPLIVQDPFLQRLAVVAVLNALLAVSLNLVLGYGGLISLGHAGFYGIGAYITALLALRLHVPFPGTVVAAAAAAALVGWLLARPILHLRGHYFAMATLAFGEIVVQVAYNWDAVTRGASGLPGIPQASFLGWTAETHRDNYYLALVALVLAVLAVWRVIHSPLGLSLMAARDDDQAAASIGIEVAQVRTRAFALAALIAGVTGALYAHYITFVSVEPFQFEQMIALLAMVAIGGMGTTAGPIIGAILLTLLPEALRGLDALRMVIYGALLMLVIGLRPEGLVGGGYRWPRRWRRGRALALEQADEPAPATVVDGRAERGEEGAGVGVE